jgi:hypothetical protein
VAGVAGVAVIGVVAWLGAVQGTPVPAQSPSVTPTTSATTTPTPSPSASDAPAPTAPTAPADDVAGIARVISPTTGETWQPPVEAPDMAARLGASEGEGKQAFLVGHRGGAEIYVLVIDEWYSTKVDSMYEVVGDQVTLIACPVSADRCAQADEAALAERGVAVDRTTRYDSLTVPTAIRVSPSWGVTTTATIEQNLDEVYGDGLLLVDPDSHARTLRQLGGAKLVEVSSPTMGVVPGLTPIHYAYVTPMGAAYKLVSRDVPSADPDSFVWDDGVARPPAYAQSARSSLAPGAHQCFWSLLAVELGHVDADWRAAGAALDGRRVYVPVPGGNAESHAVFEHERDTSWGWSEGASEMVHGAAMYPLTEQQFVDQHSLFAVQGPDDEWLLGLRSDAAATVYECA